MNRELKKSAFKKLQPVIIAVSLLVLLVGLYAKSNQCVWTDIEKIVAVGDIHGDFENLITILKATGIIDEGLNWTGGKTHFVQTGDIMDRGPDAKKAFDLIMKLEKEAEAAGGKVHMLIGNHEELNILGRSLDFEGYVTVGQFISFLPDEYREKKEKEFRKKIEKNMPQGTNADASLDSYLREYWMDAILIDNDARRKYTETFYKEYGKWVLEHNVVIKINNVVFVHGGISEKYSTKKLSSINNDFRNELKDIYLKIKFRDPLTSRPKIVFDQLGPLWYRELATNGEESMKEELDKILQNLDAKYIVIAHTPIRGVDISPVGMSRFDGKIWIIDTGISKAYGGNLSALIIDKGNFSVWGENYEE